MDYSSDTSAPAHPAVLDAMTRANRGMEASYGNDGVSRRLHQKIVDLFETTEVTVWPCVSGTAANALALSVLCSSTGSILCHEEAHIERDERGAPEFYTGGGKLNLLPGAAGQIDETALRDALAGLQPDFVHETPAEALSLTHLTECGTAYDPGRIAHFAALAKSSGLGVHLDGARFANAIVGSDATPADLSWKAGVDCLTLGLTKTGAIGCELILLFGAARDRHAKLLAHAKRGGHMPPKMRYVAAQAEAMLTDGLWLSLAETANRAARLLSDGLCQNLDVELVYPVDGNEVFVRMPASLVETLRSAGVLFYPWPGECFRFVCNWGSSLDELESLAALVRHQR
ncbi:MAG: beta-eliminating lyase-related protein [Pseudomonadota bacterium]